MAIEAVKCPSCGSTDTVELRQNNYICKYCETKFRWVDPNVQTTRVEKQACWCGHEAEGQCAHCGTAVCSIHSKGLADCIYPEARAYFVQNIYSSLDMSIEFDELLCETCYEEASSTLMTRVEELKSNGNICSQDGCFSLELVVCESCGEKKCCQNHTPFRKQFERSKGTGSLLRRWRKGELLEVVTEQLTNHPKLKPLRYQRICEQCYVHAQQNLDSKYFWE